MNFRGAWEQAGNLRTAMQLRSMSGDAVMAAYGDEARHLFDRARQREGGVIPVVVPAHNERKDLPATLLSIARSGALAIVVSNNSNDGTMDVARNMGAHVIEANDGKKVRATQEGVRTAIRELGAYAVLFTDADTLVPEGWAERMFRAVQAMDHGLGAMACGESLVWHSGSLSADLLVNASSIQHAVRKPDEPIARGHNYALALDPQGRVLDALMSLDPYGFTDGHGAADDAQTMDAMIAARVPVGRVRDPETWVLTRGRIDRFSDAYDMAIRHVPYAEVTARSYSREYGKQEPGLATKSS